MVSKVLRIQHFVNIPHIKTQIATVRDDHNSIHIFLIEERGDIYRRNGLNQTWERLDQQSRYQFQDLVNRTDLSSVPSYSTDNYIFN